VKQRYSGRQLILAKCAVVGLIALIAGLGLAQERNEIPVTILVVLALTGAAVGAYEALARGLAIILSRFWHQTAAPAEETTEVSSVGSPPPAGLRRGDIITALVVFLVAEALVWTVAGVWAAVEAGTTQDRSALFQALIRLVPIALPGSLIAGALALLLVLRRWRRRLGGETVVRLLGLAWGGPRQVTNGVLAGVALAFFILPLMGLAAQRAEPPDVMTQLAGSSTAALRAWMISAVLLAPPIEELMFRGVLLGGLTETWSIRAAAVVSGTTFWLMHGPEFVHWPAAVAIALLTILTTWLRLKSRALGPSIGAHFGYNLVLATLVWLGMVYGPGTSHWARDHQLQRIEWIWGWTANARW
jgi:membrane protease YdiL (CAAX protease family)